MGNVFNRYDGFITDGKINMVPYSEIPKKSTDYYVTYINGETRLDRLAYDYYGDCDFWWVILQANPEFGSMEFDIPDKSVLRIPYPLDASIADYKEGLKRYNKFYK